MSPRYHPKPLLHSERNNGAEFALGAPDWEDFRSFQKVQADLNEACSFRLGEPDGVGFNVEEEVL